MPGALVVAETDDVFHLQRCRHEEADLDSEEPTLTHIRSMYCEEEERSAA